MIRFAVAILVFLPCLPVVAQTGTVQGRVTDDRTSREDRAGLDDRALHDRPGADLGTLAEIPDHRALNEA